MCLAIPGKLTQVEPCRDGERMGCADFGGVVKQVCLEYTPDAIVGDYVLVHVGFAINVVDRGEAERSFQLLAEMGQLDELNTSADDATHNAYGKD